MQRKYLFLTLILILIFAGSFVHAQVREGDIVLNISPEHPDQGQNVTATLSSYSTNLDKAYISWSINGREMSRGIGKKVFLFTMEGLGVTINLNGTISTIDGQSINKTIIITPTSVDMLWEAYDSYAPPFYKGKTLAGGQGYFKVVAMPNLTSQGAKISASNLSYVWSKDGDIQNSVSGWGKNYFTFKNSYLDRGNTVEVEVSDILGGANTSGTVILQTVKPEIIFYKKDISLGTRWEQALNNGLQINENGETLVAEPYFFSPKSINSPNLTFIWSINGEQTQVPGPQNVLSIKPNSGQSGSAVIKLLVNNTKTLFQTAEKQISVEF